MKLSNTNFRSDVSLYNSLVKKYPKLLHNTELSEYLTKEVNSNEYSKFKTLLKYLSNFKDQDQNYLMGVGKMSFDELKSHLKNSLSEVTESKLYRKIKKLKEKTLLKWLSDQEKFNENLGDLLHKYGTNNIQIKLVSYIVSNNLEVFDGFDKYSYCSFLTQNFEIDESTLEKEMDVFLSTKELSEVLLSTLENNNVDLSNVDLDRVTSILTSKIEEIKQTPKSYSLNISLTNTEIDLLEKYDFSGEGINKSEMNDEDEYNLVFDLMKKGILVDLGSYIAGTSIYDNLNDFVNKKKVMNQKVKYLAYGEVIEGSGWIFRDSLESILKEWFLSVRVFAATSDFNYQEFIKKDKPRFQWVRDRYSQIYKEGNLIREKE